MSEQSESASSWWRDAVMYQVYLRSFADGNGDGIGDIAGLCSRLSYLRALGVDGIWINPWYLSPQADGGYDVADFRQIDPVLGSLADAEGLIAEVHRCGLRVVLDLVPNHTSDQHEWFRAAVAAGPGSPERARYFFREGRGSGHEQPPNNWQSTMGGPAWTRVADGEWYLHLFAPEQPDLNWAHAEVIAEFESILRFWFDRGVDGFRIDMATTLAKDPELPDLTASPEAPPASDGKGPCWDRDEVHRIFRGWRRVADEYPQPRMFVAEAWAPNPQRLANYVRADELHTAFDFDFLQCAWDAARLRSVIDSSLASLGSVGAPATWVLSNHDVIRHVSRLGRPTTQWRYGRIPDSWEQLDVVVGTRRARAAALLMLALPGGAYLYQGEELGLPEVEDLPAELLQDPMWEGSGQTERGRDGCRVPLPWSGDSTAFGFSPPDAAAAPWLPQPESWKQLNVEAQLADPESSLGLYQAALRLRRTHAALGDGILHWDEAPEGLLSFRRDPGFRCIVNLSAHPQPLPPHQQVLLHSGPLAGSLLPPDTAAWIQQ